MESRPAIAVPLANGISLTWSMDGTFQVTLAVGSSRAETPGGRVMTVDAAGVQAVTYPSGAVLVQRPDGSRTVTLSGGGLDRPGADRFRGGGTSLPDGKTVTWTAEGAIETLGVDGVRTLGKADRTVIQTGRMERSSRNCSGPVWTMGRMG